MPKLINLRHTHHTVPAGAVRIDRATKWGNPFVIGKDGDRAQVIAKHEAWFISDDPRSVALRAALDELKDKDLACWCHPLPCHGTSLMRAANRR